MSATRDRLDQQAAEVKEELQEMGEVVKDLAQEKLAQVSEIASEYCEQGRDKIHGIAFACEQYIRQRPLRSVLMAAGVGWLLGRFWKHR